MTSIHRRSAARAQRGAFARTGIAAAIAVAIAAVGFLYLTAPHGTARALDEGAAAAAAPESAAATAGAPASAGGTFHGAHDFSRMDPEPDPSPAATGAYER